MKLLLVAVVVLASALPLEAASGVTLSMLTQGKKVIPIVLEFPGLTETDIRLPDLVVTNDSSEPVIPLDISVVGTLRGEEVARYRVGKDIVQALIKHVNPQLKSQASDERARQNLGVALGKTDLDFAKLSGDLRIKPTGQEVILLSKVLFFHSVSCRTVDTLRIVLDLDRSGNRESAELSVPLTRWETKVKYRFPLKGSILAVCMPQDYLQHRQAHSQEFAIDMLGVRQDKNGEMSTSKKDIPAKLTDFYIYGKDVLSVADGTVVQVSNAYPESETVSPVKWSEEAYEETVIRLSGKVPPLAILCGNYVVVKHGPEEFSFYAHLKQKSIRVKVGDKVKAGQRIAQVGSTGHSTEPHLHFQLMDSADFLTANGLPIMFEEISANQMVQNFTGANTLARSDFLHVVVGKE